MFHQCQYMASARNVTQFRMKGVQFEVVSIRFFSYVSHRLSHLNVSHSQYLPYKRF
jgi:hypothetical protein